MKVQWLKLCEVGAARSFFSKSHLKMEQMLDCMYFWANDAPIVHATEEADGHTMAIPLSIGATSCAMCHLGRPEPTTPG